jgi:hypothetical protein
MNDSSFNGHANTVQQNQLRDLLGAALYRDFFNELDNNWTTKTGTITKESDTVIKIAGEDTTSIILADYGLKVNDDVFLTVVSTNYDATDTFITVTGYTVPDTITLLEYKSDSKYMKLLNGTVYDYCGDEIDYFGLRPFLIWHFLSSYITDGDLKQSDAGNTNIFDNTFTQASTNDKKFAKDSYLQNSSSMFNDIVQFLDENTTVYTKWKSTKSKDTVNKYSFIVH